MEHRICIQTPAGEKHSVEVDDKGAPDHAAHTGLRIGVSKLLFWVDHHVEWPKPGDASGPKVPVPFAGDGDWIIRGHPKDRTCELCAPKEPTQ